MSAHEPLWGSDRELSRALATLLNAEGQDWLTSRRWFADKGRPISEIAIADARYDSVDADRLALTLVRVRFTEGAETLYLIPLALSLHLESPTVVGTIRVGSRNLVVIDAVQAPWFGHWLLDAFQEADQAGAGSWRFFTEAGEEPVIALARQAPGVMLGAEQSNTSFRFGEALIVKLFRRIQPGPNPDEEAMRGLRSIGFPNVPALVGSALWVSGGGDHCPIAVAQKFVPNDGDGWSWFLSRLAGVAQGGDGPWRDRFAAERLLGRRTGELHVALAQVDDPCFSPMEATVSDVEVNAARTRAALAAAIRLLDERQRELPEAIRPRLPAITDLLRAVGSWTMGYAAEVGIARIRTHGDYHLGQTLRTLDNDWAIIDFEGEPARDVAERRRRSSALKDVAGMLRSFAYARGATERGLPSATIVAAGPRLAAWERDARSAFLDAYRSALNGARPALAPKDDADFFAALRAWELDKALYEIAYEAANRPDWIDLPIRALFAMGEDQLSTDAEAGPTSP